jgi:hypothetical protein
VVNSRLEELNFDESELVIQALELAKKVVNEPEGFVVGLLCHLESDEADLEVLSLKRAALGGGPFYTVLGDGDFDIGAIGDFLDEVKQLTDYIAALASCCTSKQNHAVLITYQALLTWPLRKKRRRFCSP